jgi:hypothetical protein
MSSFELLSVDRDVKTIKGREVGVLTGIQYLAPAREAGFTTVCPYSTAGCRKCCLFTAGHAMIFPKVNQARVRKTAMFFNDREGFTAAIKRDIRRLIVKAKKENLKPVVRLNGTSDIYWENYGIIQEFPEVWFYDYTKVPLAKRTILNNYRLTYSISERKNSWNEAIKYLEVGQNAAVVFRKSTLVALAMERGIMGYPVIDGDEHDARMKDSGVIVALKAKGRARKDTSGFVLDSVP